jgi:hypothetical protein
MAAQALESMDLTAMVHSLAEGIAQAQTALDLNSLKRMETFATSEVELLGDKVNLLEIGFTPNFYQFAETTLELKISVSMTSETSSEKTTSESTSTTKSKAEVSIGFFSVSASTTTTTKTSSVDARYASRFQYSTQASSLLRTRIVPVPPPKQLMDAARELAKE